MLQGSGGGGNAGSSGHRSPVDTAVETPKTFKVTLRLDSPLYKSDVSFESYEASAALLKSSLAS